ncbi:MAG: hypothetical protein MUF02_09445 [Acidobacteria bacterium]|jgi:hypothetical protein|nr:hypothetical protein [Acidobacteriota bacterium]
MKLRPLFTALALSALLSAPLPATETELSSQLSGWFSLNDDLPPTPRLSLRWQPALSLEKALGAEWRLDSEFSLDASTAASAPEWKAADVTGRIKPYRLWLRLSHSRFEARLGLQKLNFGSATVFRPLMWFDALDPRDPLQITDGVYGLLLRYYFKSNANIWLWGLYGNDKTKGWETRPTAAGTMEFGGRFQAPLLSGEAGLTFHQRRLDPTGADAAHGPAERRLALDGKWDLGIGLWLEASVIHQDDPVEAFPWQRALALGVDYTFKLGNGLYLLVEHFFSQAGTTLTGGRENDISLSAIVTRYPLGLLDSLGAMVYFDWRQKQTYNFIRWQRTYDHWQFHAMLFCNPRSDLVADAGGAGNNSYSGRGFLLMAVWNI